ncbi:hypothetical protein Taro_016404 [Colocasia esculenta]|uniref:Uncharacterized protein n=1 Tax=Colocasia esculenta TaxID=4460 RepID=A0A843UQ68_COLES|nr:hypothetical protein [Colocasia esculenta]
MNKVDTIQDSRCSVKRSGDEVDALSKFNNELESFGGRLELLGSRRKAGNPELHPLHLLLHPEHQLVLDLRKGSDEEPVESDGTGQE